MMVCGVQFLILDDSEVVGFLEVLPEGGYLATFNVLQQIELLRDFAVVAHVAAERHARGSRDGWIRDDAGREVLPLRLITAPSGVQLVDGVPSVLIDTGRSA